MAHLRDCIRVALAWNSIVEDVAEMRLVLDNLQTQQAKKELQAAEDVLPRVARECYKWLLCPAQDNPTAAKSTVEVFPLNTGGVTLGPEIERVCIDNVLVITTWSPIHLRNELKQLYWKADKPAFGAMAFWDDTLRYLYLPRLKSRSVLEQAIVKGAGSRDFFGTAYGCWRRCEMNPAYRKLLTHLQAPQAVTRIGVSDIDDGSVKIGGVGQFPVGTNKGSLQF